MTASTNDFSRNEEIDFLTKRCKEQEMELAELRLNELMLNSLLDFLPDLVYFKDRNSRFILINEAMQRRFGVSHRDEVAGKTDFDCYANEHADKAYRDEQKIIDTGTPIINITEREAWESGKVTWVSTSKAPLRDAHGNIIGTFGISSDVTKSKIAEEKILEINKAIQDERNLMRTVIDIIPDSIYVKDSDHKFVLSNKQHFESLGLSKREEIVGKTDYDFFPTELAEQFTQGEDQVIHHGLHINQKEEEGINPQTNEKIWLSTSKVPLRNHKLTGLVGFSKDITLVKESIFRLETARIEAETASIEKSEFLAKMSHEIRTPLNGIIGLTELINESDLSAENLKKFTLINESGNILLTIINDLLDFSKLESGNVELEKLEFRLRSTVEELIDIIFFKKNKEALEIYLVIESNVPDDLVGDPGRLKQILFNLLGNANKFTQTGHITLRVSTLQIKDKTTSLRFSIEDTGIGIAKESLANIFEGFSQADTSITRKYGGTGLGLSICKELVNLMQGEIWVESPSPRTGCGCTFSFTARFDLPESIKFYDQPFEQINNKSILILDPDKLSMESLIPMFEHLQIKTTPTLDSKEALMYLHTQDFDLVFLPYSIIHDKKYFDLQKALQEKKIPVIATSTQDMSVDPKLIKNKTIVGLLRKPIHSNHLLDSILEALGGISRNRGDEQPKEKHSALKLLQGISTKQQLLVAEDNPVNQQIIAAILNKTGLDVEIVENGQLALEAVKKSHYDVILMDLQMPLLDGLTATGKIRKIKGFDKTPIIALTAQAMHGDREVCLQAGMDDYISKPFKPELIYKTLHKWLSTIPPK